MIYIFYFFAFLQLVFSWKSLQSGIAYFRFFRRQTSRRTPPSKFSASIIVPCKGRDQGLSGNLRALMVQDHGEYDVTFVVESEDDPACPVIREVISAFPLIRSRLVIAGKAQGTGQKVHNLIEAVRSLRNKMDALVFVDSDARPGEDWLAALLGSLDGSGTGCATGYRWFIPERGGVASQIRSVWNASIASALGDDESRNFCWGGSTAILRRDFDSLRVAEHWEGRLSDDFALTSIVRSAGGSIRFVPKCLTASIEDCSFRELIEFTTRQMKITRVYRPDLWGLSMIGSSLHCGTIAAAIILLFRVTGVHQVVTAAFLAVVIGFGTTKAILRLRAVALALPDYGNEVRKQFFWQTSLWFITPLLFLFNDLAALTSRRIVWRGIEYEITSPNRTRIIAKR